MALGISRLFHHLHRTMRSPFFAAAALCAFLTFASTPATAGVSVAPVINGTLVPTVAEGATASPVSTGTCLGCDVNEVGNVVSSRINDAASISVPIGVLASAGVRVDLASPLSGARTAGMVIRNASGLIDAELLDRITLRTRLAGQVQDEATGASVLRVSVLSRDRYAVSLRPTGDFDAIEIEVAGALSLFTDLDVLYATARLGAATIIRAQSSMGATLLGDRNGCLGCTAVNPERMIDASAFTAAEVRMPLSALGSITVGSDYGRLLPAGSRTGMMVSSAGGPVDVATLTQLELVAMLDGVVVDQASGSDLIRQVMPNGRVLLTFKTSGSVFDQVVLVLNGLVGVSVEIDVHSILTVVPPPALSPMEQDEHVRALELLSRESDAAPSQGAGTLEVSPNPFGESARLTVTANAGEPVSITAYDVLGREVARIHEGTLPSRSAHFGLDTASWPSGVYVVQVVTPTARETVTVTRR